jgi:hypothetical protein
LMGVAISISLLVVALVLPSVLRIANDPNVCWL